MRRCKDCGQDLPVGCFPTRWHVCSLCKAFRSALHQASTPELAERALWRYWRRWMHERKAATA